MDKLWAPWRMKYITMAQAKNNKCLFCEAKDKKDSEAYILKREKECFALLNIFPYNNGHIMIAPYRHIGKIEELTEKEGISLFSLVKESICVLKKILAPDGFNIGMNIGKTAGAGVENHLHIHIVPRWNGDTNFMPIITNTKVISQSLEEAYKLLKQDFQ